MKLIIFGATGRIGQRLVQEALGRGHSVTAAGRNPSKITLPNVKTVQANIEDAASIAQVVQGYDAVLSAVGSMEDAGFIIRATHALIDGLKRTSVRRVIVVGGAGSLEVAPGQQVVDSPEFPAAWKPAALSHRDALNLWRAEKQLDWSYASPAALIDPGVRTGKFRLGTDQLIVDASGKSAISMEDYAVALLDELENPKFIKKRFTVGY